MISVVFVSTIKSLNEGLQPELQRSWTWSDSDVSDLCLNEGLQPELQRWGEDEPREGS